MPTGSKEKTNQTNRPLTLIGVRMYWSAPLTLPPSIKFIQYIYYSINGMRVLQKNHTEAIKSLATTPLQIDII